MILQIYTIIHTLISLVALFAGFVVLFGLLTGQSHRWLDEMVSHQRGCNNGNGFLLSVSRNYTCHQAWYHFVGRPCDHDIRPLCKASHRSVAPDLCRRRFPCSLFQCLRRNRAILRENSRAESDRSDTERAAIQTHSARGISLVRPPHACRGNQIPT